MSGGGPDITVTMVLGDSDLRLAADNAAVKVCTRAEDNCAGDAARLEWVETRPVAENSRGGEAAFLERAACTWAANSCGGDGGPAGVAALLERVVTCPGAENNSGGDTVFLARVGTCLGWGKDLMIC